MISNPEKTIYALYHKNMIDSTLAHYRQLGDIDPHKLTLQLLVSINLDRFIRDKNIKEFNKSEFRYGLFQWLFSLVIRDKKQMDIIRYIDHDKIPWTKHFEEFNEETCEYIRIERGEDNNPEIFFSVQLFHQSSVLFRQFIITLMADRFKGQVEDPIQLVYIFCSELCVLIDDLYNSEGFFESIENSYNIAKGKK